MRPKGSARKNQGEKLRRGRPKGSKTKSRHSQEEKIRKKIRYHPGTVALREIKRYQKHNTPLTSKSPFDRRVRNILKTLDPEIRLKKSTLECMREATEVYLVEVLQDSNLCAIHGNRKTVMLKDVILAHRIRGGENRAYY